MSGVAYHEFKIVIMYHTKCAQTTLYDVFGKPWDIRGSLLGEAQTGLSDISPLSEYKKKYPTYYTVTFIRNPWDRMVSGWYYFSQNNSFSLSFSRYVKHIYKQTETKIPLLTPLTFYIDRSVDFIGRFENLHNDIHRLANKFGVVVNNIPHLTKSKKRKSTDYTFHYTEITKQMVYEMYKEDIERFDYKF